MQEEVGKQPELGRQLSGALCTGTGDARCPRELQLRWSGGLRGHKASSHIWQKASVKASG